MYVLVMIDWFWISNRICFVWKRKRESVRLFFVIQVQCEYLSVDAMEKWIICKYVVAVLRKGNHILSQINEILYFTSMLSVILILFLSLFSVTCISV